ncbi:hypothetical protein [Streptomyces sp. NPDC086023]
MGTPTTPSSFTEGARLKAITLGMTRHGEDIGRWLATQRGTGTG